MYCDWTYITLIVALMLILCMVKGSPMRPTGGMSIANTGTWRAVFALVIILHHIARMGLLGTGPAVSVLTPHSVGAWGGSGFFIESAALMHLPSYMAIIYVFGLCIFAAIGIHRLMCAINIHGLCSRLTRGAEQ